MEMFLPDSELMAPAPISEFGMSGSIAERRAAKCGFNASQITDARFRMSASLGGCGLQPCLTIPAGISPTVLLDSPVMLPNSQAQLSPTTGTFSFPPFLDENSILSSGSVTDQASYHQGSSDFSITPPGPAAYLTNFPVFGENQETAADDRDYTLMQFEIQPDLPEEVKKWPMKSPASEGVFGSVDLKPVHLASEVPNGIDAGGSVPMKKEYAQEDAGASQDKDLKAPYNPLGMVKTSEDGYNWRKYGQKQVKGSEYPRSYYKCTHPNCQVKKKVERSHDGQITEIIYKGAHNHPKPQPPRRGSIGSAYALPENVTETGVGKGMVASFNTEGGLVWRNVQVGPKEVKPDGLDGLSPTSVLTDISDPLSSPPGKGSGMYEPEHSPELMSTLASIDEDEVGSAAEEVDDDEPDFKRRKPENCLVESTTASRAVREPRVVIQVESEIDILEDGYRWRKYGQKVVKGNPNPRSYYKCTSTSCLVRKHVERASQDLKYVITTYEGKHNHDIPAARNSGGSGNGNAGGNAALTPASLAQTSALALPRNTNVMSKAENQVQDLILYDRKPEFGLDYLRTSSLLTNFRSDIKFGQSAMYPMKFPPLRSCGSFGLGPGPGPIHHPRSMNSVYPDLPGPMPFKFSQPSCIPMTTLDYNNGKALGMTQPFHPGEQIKEKDVRFIAPKQEHIEDHFYDSSFAIMDLASASQSAMFPQGLVSFP